MRAPHIGSSAHQSRLTLSSQLAALHRPARADFEEGPSSSLCSNNLGAISLQLCAVDPVLLCIPLSTLVYEA
ncbi:hypothetical protein FA95DRAFT_1563164 [Auriscalpium vulgare]|uniref:Uncharacterized protein n=1 Tax=Auriscalpium vulgare TaxID=40419 RepID=A0ACB8RHJ3_9AGAM|nr:hypothetical protein FA95DRAFT_1563164 [Auriscalpium vulgare]